MPTGTSIVVNTRPATTSLGSQLRSYRRSVCSPGSQRVQPDVSDVSGRARRPGSGCGKEGALLCMRRPDRRCGYMGSEDHGGGFSGVTKKKASPRITYTASNWTPFSQSDRPSPATWPVINTESSTVSTSPAENARSIGAGPMTKLASTSTGATNSATCTLEPIAIESERSMRFFSAAETAVACSAALPRMATMNTPTKTLLRPNSCAVGSIAPTRISLTQATSTVAAASTVVALAVDHGGWCSSWCSGPREPENRALWVTSENTRNRKYTASSTTAIDMLSRPNPPGKCAAAAAL